MKRFIFYTIVLISISALLPKTANAAKHNQGTWTTYCDAICVELAKQEYRRKLVEEMMSESYYRALLGDRETNVYYSEPEIDRITKNPSNDKELCLSETESRFNTCMFQAKIMNLIMKTAGAASSIPNYKLLQIADPHLSKTARLTRVGIYTAAAEIAVEAGTITNEYRCNQFKINQNRKCNQLN